MTVKDVYEAVNAIAPFFLACKWDNCGLVAGSMNDTVTGIIVTLDADLYALDFAKANGCNVVVSHHPIIMDPLRQITDSHPVYNYLKNGVNVISAHTNLDAAKEGINDILAEILGMKDPRDLMLDDVALGRYGEVDADADYIDKIAKALDTKANCLITRPIKKAAVVSGSGGSGLYEAMAVGCDTLITGEAKHDHFVTAENCGVNLVTLGHYETEVVVVKKLVKKLSSQLDIKVLASDRKPLIDRR